MKERWYKRVVVVLPVVALAALAVGCARKPATTAASAPPPVAPAQPHSSDVVKTSAPMPPAPKAPATETARPPVRDFVENEALHDIHFDFDKSDIRKADAKVLDANAAWLNEHRDYLLMIQGHCDERGTNEYNVALGSRRAKSTMNYLVSRGVQASRISMISYGEERPLCREHTEACWAKNRRAHFLVKPQ